MEDRIPNEEAERDYLAEIGTLIEEHRGDSDFVGQLEEYHPFDIARALLQTTREIRKEVLQKLPPAFSANLFEALDEDEAIEIVKELPSPLAVSIIDKMETDDALDLMQYLEDEEEDTTFVNLLSPKKREELKKFWHYTEDQIGSVMSTNYIELPASMSVKDAMRKVTAIAGDTEYISILYVVDKQRLVGTLKLKDLIVARAAQTIADVMDRRFASARPEEDKETVARRMQDYGESSMPILDENGKLLGILTHDVMIDIISEVHSEDYGRLAGLGSADLEDQTETTFSAVKSRLPWLALLLGLSFLSSLVLSLFAGAFPDAPGAGLLAANLAVYLPLILDMSGNTGTQSLAVMIRFLIENPDSLERKTVGIHLRREWFSGMIQALLLGILTFGIVCFTEALSTGMQLDSRTLLFATVTAFAIFVALAMANLLGALIPLLMAKLKFDPAVASGPFITTVADLVSLTLYYSISLLLLLRLYR